MLPTLLIGRLQADTERTLPAAGQRRVEVHVGIDDGDGAIVPCDLADFACDYEATAVRSIDALMVGRPASTVGALYEGVVAKQTYLPRLQCRASRHNNIRKERVVHMHRRIQLSVWSALLAAAGDYYLIDEERIVCLARNIESDGRVEIGLPCCADRQHARAQLCHAVDRARAYLLDRQRQATNDRTLPAFVERLLPLLFVSG